MRTLTVNCGTSSAIIISLGLRDWLETLVCSFLEARPVQFNLLELSPVHFSPATFRLSTSSGHSFTAFLTATPTAGVSVEGKTVSGLLVTAAHCVLDPDTLDYLPIQATPPFLDIQVIRLPPHNIEYSDPVSGCGITLREDLVLLLGFGPPLPISTCFWEYGEIPSIFPAEIVGWPDTDAPEYLYPCYRFQNLASRPALRQEIISSVFQGFGHKTTGRGIAVCSGSLIGLYVSAAYGMCGAPVLQEVGGIKKVVGLVVCGPLHFSYVALLNCVQALLENDTKRAIHWFRTLSRTALVSHSVAHVQVQEIAEFRSTLSKLYPLLSTPNTRFSVLHKLNSLLPWLSALGDSCSRNYNLAISVTSPSFKIAQEWSRRFRDLKGPFGSLTEFIMNLAQLEESDPAN